MYYYDEHILFHMLIPAAHTGVPYTFLHKVTPFQLTQSGVQWQSTDRDAI